MKNKFLTISLFIILFTPIFGVLIFLNWQKGIIKEEVKGKIFSSMPKEELVLLTFSIKDSQTKIEWEDSKEFKYQEQMYDVVISEEKNDSIYLWCHWDQEETKISKQIDNIYQALFDHERKDNQNIERIIEFIKSIYLAPDLINAIPQTKVLVMVHFKVSLTEIIISPPSPPPRLS